MSFLNKVILLTGASSGIGLATAHRFAKHGAALALSGRNVDNLKAVAKDIGANETFIVPGDITKETDTENIVKKTIEHFGKLDILVNNAGRNTRFVYFSLNFHFHTFFPFFSVHKMMKK